MIFLLPWEMKYISIKHGGTYISEELLHVDVVGPLRVYNANNKDVAPRLLKSRAILAMLAILPQRRHTRRWFQEKLWGDRSHEQGLASLRTCIADIRRSLGPYRDCIVTDHFEIALDMDRVHVDLDRKKPHQSTTLIDGFDLPNANAFEEWLTLERRTYEAQVEAQGLEPEPSASLIINASGSAVTKPPLGQASRLSKLRVTLERSRFQGDDGVTIKSEIFLDAIAKTLNEWSVVTIVDSRADGSHLSEDRGDVQSDKEISLRIDVARSGNQDLYRIDVFEKPNRTIWSQFIELDSSDQFCLSHPRVLIVINQVVERVIEEAAQKTSCSTDVLNAPMLARVAAQKFYRLGAQNFRKADELFDQAYSLEPKGLFLAWRAYLRTFQLGERQYGCRQALTEEGNALKRRALESDPMNSMVLALCAHAETMLRRDYVAGYELAERSVAINPANALGWSTLGIAEAYLGDAQRGFAQTLLARQAAGATRFRFQFDSAACIAGTLAGDMERARRCGEASHALAPSFAPPIRYLAAHYADAGDQERAFEKVEQLKLREPDFSFDQLHDSAYPAAGLRKADLLRNLPTREI